MDKYAQLKRFYHDIRIQVNMYAFVYIYPPKIPMEDHFPATTTFVVNYKKVSTQVTVPKHWLGFSYICSKYIIS